LAEELLKGEFAGKSVVKVEVKKVGDKKQLVFNGRAEGRPVSMEEPVAAGATAGGEADAPGLSPAPKSA
jgi:hypothetical protein